ncbi:ABC transporter substrate-binding protein [Aquisalimonas sp. 2447]|nr:ABC transporter substrate-binding protein [Aquisalimonas sp. 2447]
MDGADLLLGPLSGSEGIAVRDYSRDVDGVTFINGASAAQETTLRDPSDNFFRFSTDGAQWMAGLGTYVVDERDWKRVATVAEDYSFPYAQVAGFLYEFCQAGGEVAERFWTPIGTSDYSSVVFSIPDDVDAIFVALTGSDAVDFLQQYRDAGGDKPIIGGTNTVDGTVLSAEGGQRDHIVGTPSGAPVPGEWDNEQWKNWVDRYHEMFGDDALSEPSIFAHAYYTNTLAMLTALEDVGGELGDHSEYREVLANLEIETPTGAVSLDENRAAIADMFLREVRVDDDGNLYNANVGVAEGVNQTLGMDRDEFLALEAPSRDHPRCAEIR